MTRFLAINKTLLYISLSLACLIFSGIVDVVNSEITFRNEYNGSNRETQNTSFTRGSFTHINAEQLADALGLKTYKENVKRKLVLYIDDKQLKFTADNHFVIYEDKTFQFPVKTIEEGDALYFPVSPFIEELYFLFPGVFSFDGNVLVYGKGEFNITGIRTAFENGKIFIDISTAEPLAFVADSAIVNSGFELFIPGGKADLRKINNSTVPQGLESLDCRTDSSGCFIQLGLKDDAALEDSVRTIESGIRITVSGTSSSEQLNHTLQNFHKGLFFDTIVIDAGHGGKDPGARGKSGLKEKDVVLDIAKRLETLLKGRLGVKTVMTRDKDVFIPLYERGKIANQSGGKLFVSIHANANKSSKPNGVETYFLSPARTDKALKVAEMENAAIEYETDRSRYKDLDAEDFILLSMTKSNDLKESELLAGIVQERFGKSSGLKNRGVDQAGFYVLYGANMPAILVEVAFISNKREEKLLKSKKFRQDVAEIIYKGIEEFCEMKKKEK